MIFFRNGIVPSVSFFWAAAFASPLFLILSASAEEGKNRAAPFVRSIPPPVRVVYFTPSDDLPAPDAVERLSRVMTDVQAFYRSEMERSGFGPLTFSLDREGAGPLRVHYVRGKKKRSEYSRGDYDLIRREVTAALFHGAAPLPTSEELDGPDKTFGAKEAISSGETAMEAETDAFDPKWRLHLNQEIVVIFQRLLTWDDGQIVMSGPFVGGGNHLFGVAFVFDGEKLDSALLTSGEPAEIGDEGAGAAGNGGRGAKQPLTLGEFNSRYIGGLAHELGHAFGLIHNAETDADRAARGFSLMGIGNNVYGRPLRGEGLGAFLTEADALRLSRCRAFVGDIPFAHVRPQWRFLALSAAFQKKERSNGGENPSPERGPHDGESAETRSSAEPTNRLSDAALIVKGRIESNVPLIGVVAYNDDAAVPGDYDAKSYAARPDADGSFTLTITDLTATEYQMRIVGLCANGASIGSEVTYNVETDLAPSGLARFNSFALETLVRRLFECWNVKRLEEVIQELQHRPERVDPDLIRKAKHLHRLMTNPIRPVEPESVSPETKSLDLSEAEWAAARNGMEILLRDILPEEIFITVGGRFFESGLFAHAPSVHRFRLNGKWTELTTGYGIADGRCGSAIFRIIGDGRELFAGPIVNDHQVREASVPLDGVDILDLVVEPTDDGKSQDWGVWVNPVLKRSE